MSSTTRSTSSGRSAATRSPTVSVQAGCPAPKKVSTFLVGDLREVLAPLVGVDVPAVAHRAQQRAGQRAGADAGLEHPGARVDVRHRDDLRGVLRVDDGGAARHRQDVVGQQRAQRQVVHAPGGAHDAALGLADQRVVVEVALVRVELLAWGERERVVPALGVGQLDQVPRLEGSLPVRLAGLLGLRRRGGLVRFAHRWILPARESGPDRLHVRPSAERAGRTRLLTEEGVLDVRGG
jgi:hypothetical protein